ncbi:MAG TPA: hypothetical protein VK960_06300 [Acidimicrobiia bacterium]|nr:hypothetical protein [Acidimicrobiia bacterium]
MAAIDPTGHFAIFDFGFTITDHGGTLVMAAPGVPEGYEPRLERVGPTGLRVTTGYLAGAEMELTVEEGGVTGGLIGGAIPVLRLDGPPEQVPGGGLVAPDLGDDAERDRVFEDRWTTALADGAATADPYPVYSLVQWLMRRDEVIFHGSNRTEIEEFTPRRESMEIGNTGGHGNLGAVYGTHDGLWAMFFAVIDRSRLRGSIRNGVGMYESGSGDRIDLYRFSVDHRSLDARPFTDGMLYILPRDRFERIPLYPGGPPSNEWACHEPVRPLTKIAVAPTDFPFLDQIGAHDDGELVRLSELNDEVYARVVDAIPITGGFRLVFEGLVPAVRDEWMALGQRFFPDVGRRLIDDTTVEMTGPPAFIHTMERRLAERDA